MMKTSTKGLKPCAFHFRSLAATTEIQQQTLLQNKKKQKEKKRKQMGRDGRSLLTFHVNFVFAVGLRQNVHTQDHLANGIHPRC